MFPEREVVDIRLISKCVDRARRENCRQSLALNWRQWSILNRFHSQTSACSIRPRRRLEAAGPPIQLRQVSERGQRPGTWPKLKEVGLWMQDTSIESGRATFPGMGAPDRGVVQACANLLTASLG